MKVILLQDVRNVGKKDEVKEVSDGYARNSLLPKKLAEPATASALKRLQIILMVKEKEKNESRDHLEKLKKMIEGNTLEFHLRTDSHGTLFGSINGETILSSLRREKFITKERVSVLLPRPIKELGEHTIVLSLGDGIEAKIRARVLPQQ
ncbi:MAG: 50S ribosomal protein L9 [Patescibacteria group bacterium]